MKALRLRLAASALAPAAIILAIRFWDRAETGWLVSTLLLLFAAVVSVSLLFLMRARARTNPQPHRVREAVEQSREVPTVLLTYIFPFVFLSIDAWQDLGAAVAFAALAMLLALRTDIWLSNPTLLLFGYRVYSVRLRDQEESQIAFSRVLLKEDANVSVVKLATGAMKIVKING